MSRSKVELIHSSVENPINQWSAEVEQSFGESACILNEESAQQKTVADYEGDAVSDGHSLSFFETVAFTVNYVMGTGFLTIPWAFFQAGTALSLVTITVMVIPALLAILFVLESMARASVVFTDENLFMASQKYQPVEKDRKMKNWKRFMGLHNGKASNRRDTSARAIGTRKVEVTELCGLFIGKHGKICYTIVLSICKLELCFH